MKSYKTNRIIFSVGAVIIGIVLLCILGLVLLILAALLFVPFRYEMDISGDLQEKALNGKAYVRWLLRIVSFKTDILSPKDIRYTLRIFGIPFKRGSFGGGEEESNASETSEEAKEDATRLLRKALRRRLPKKRSHFPKSREKLRRRPGRRLPKSRPRRRANPRKKRSPESGNGLKIKSIS